MATQQTQRAYFLDNLKTLLAILVVTVHVALAYDPDIWWFFKGTPSSSFLSTYYKLNSIFMGIFFMLSAYFLPFSYDRKGPKLFLKDRLIRLIIPIILGLFLIIIPLNYIYHINFRHCGYNTFFAYTKYVFFGIGGNPNCCTDQWYHTWPDLKVAHLWFLQHLVVYSLLYVLIRKIVKKPVLFSKLKSLYPSVLSIIFFALIMSLLVFFIRIWYPLDYWTGFLGAIQAEYANFPKYALFVFAGIVAYRKNWFLTYPKSIGYKWLILGITLLLLTFIGEGKLSFVLKKGGLNWESLVWSTWDCFMVVSLSIGLITLFREKLNFSGPLLKIMSDNTFSVYIIHVPIVAFVQYALVSLKIPVLEKSIIEMFLGVILTFVISYSIRKISFVRRIV